MYFKANFPFSTLLLLHENSYTSINAIKAHAELFWSLKKASCFIPSLVEFSHDKASLSPLLGVVGTHLL